MNQLNFYFTNIITGIAGSTFFLMIMLNLKNIINLITTVTFVTGDYVIGAYESWLLDDLFSDIFTPLAFISSILINLLLNARFFPYG